MIRRFPIVVFELYSDDIFIDEFNLEVEEADRQANRVTPCATLSRASGSENNYCIIIFKNLRSCQSFNVIRDNIKCGCVKGINKTGQQTQAAGN